ncbi:DUF5694 domain-containing protein [Pedobacter nototheniae]|uniref:DUF5694 domain-containing protein n=1 Tax=Pedobacter nototheniae TaxID=2488994 RepID=UPI00293064D9|nr:DUF5694 domain-containing protein [Pedobacter nototheniae]
MKTILKLSLLLLALNACTLKLSAQNQIEIVIMGSAHDNSKSTENFQLIIDKLKNFNPDMVFGEYTSAEDYPKLAANNWAVTSFSKGYNFLVDHNPKKIKNLSTEIDRAQKALESFPYYHKTRMNLAVNYAKNFDRANTEYQIFVLENYMKSSFGKGEQATYSKIFGNVDSLAKVRLYRAGSEYSKIYFPLIYQLKQNKIYSMDCQQYDAPWSVAWAKADSLVKIMGAKAKADTLSPEARTVKAIKKYSAYTKEDYAVFQASEYAGMNTARYATLDASWNFYGGEHFYGYDGFPTDAIKAMIEQWMLRNQGMCDNIVNQAKQQHAKRIVVGVGASHRKWMEQILAKRTDVKLINYNDLH